MRKALNGWIYVLPFEPQTLSRRKFKEDVRSATERHFAVDLNGQCAPGCDVASCSKDPSSFPAASGAGTCYNPALVGTNADQVCCALNSCPCTSVTGKGIATKDAKGLCPGGCNGTCNLEAITNAAKGIFNDDMVRCLQPIDVRGEKCCSASSGCVCTAVNTRKPGTDVAILPPIDSAAAALYDAVMLWARAVSRVLATKGALLKLERVHSLFRHSGVHSAGNATDGSQLLHAATTVAFPGV